MRFFSVRSLALAALVPAFFALTVSGCAKQNEGERCGDSLGAGASDDCGDNLTCKHFGPEAGDNRCCYTDGHVTDSRCEPTSPTSSSVAGAGGRSTTTDGGASTGGNGGGGAANSSEPAGASGEGS
jgi:hypothetical protein